MPQPVCFDIAYHRIELSGYDSHICGISAAFDRRSKCADVPSSHSFVDLHCGFHLWGSHNRRGDDVDGMQSRIFTRLLFPRGEVSFTIVRPKVIHPSTHSSSAEPLSKILTLSQLLLFRQFTREHCLHNNCLYNSTSISSQPFDIQQPGFYFLRSTTTRLPQNFARLFTTRIQACNLRTFLGEGIDL